MPNSSQCFFLIGLFILTINWSVAAPPLSIQLGPRPMYLVDLMENSLLKKTLQNCEKGPFKKSKFSFLIISNVFEYKFGTYLLKPLRQTDPSFG